MASDGHPRYRTLVIVAICATASVLMAAFLKARKRWQSGNSSSMNVNNSQQHQQELDGSHDVPSSDSSDNPAAGDGVEVFLSCRGTGIRKTFTDYLYHSLIDAGVRTFRDNEELRAGEEIGPELMKSIRQSKIGIPIFSADYASSEWCLMEVAEMVKSMKESKQLIMPLFLDVTPDEAQHQTGSYAKPFSQHEKRFGQEKVQAWRDALKEVVKLKGLELNKVANGHQGEFVKLVVAKVLRELKKSYLEMGTVLVGIEDRAEEIVKKLEVGIDYHVQVFGIWGMGGIGKTTLAKFVYNQIVDNFESNSFLKDIRETSRYPNGHQYLQSKLVSDILELEPQDYATVEEGINVLKERLHQKKVLILLDDVDHIDQIKALAADVGWFGQGSRIIITTREKDVLEQFHVPDLYEVPLLDEGHALELFCMHAFRNKSPRPDLAEQALEIVNITGRLPLALEVMGSFLSVYGGRKDMWHATIEKLKFKLDMFDIQDKLKISYESLECEQKETFLDIACFFIGMDVRLVIPMWKDTKFSPEVGIEILQLKSLIKIGEDNMIWMHDQLRDLGRSVVEQEDKEPGRRSRLWHGEDAFDVLVEQQGTSKVEAISLEGYHFMEEEDSLNDDMYRNLSRLRILELASAWLDGNFQGLFRQLRWLSWHRKNISPPVNLILRNLIVLDLSRSLIRDKWIGWSSIKFGSKLKVLNLKNCPISRTPDFSAFPSLESLILESCVELVWVDPSIGLLKDLILLNLRRCWGLKKLPEQLGSMESLVELLIDNTQVEELPISRGMINLEVLSANRCINLHEIPASIGSLVNLRRLSLLRSGVKELPNSIGQLTSLVELILSGTNIRRLPDFVGDLHDLELLKIDETRITFSPCNLGSLKKLKVLDAWFSPKGGVGDQIISDGILNLSSLRVLRFSKVNSLPAGMSALSCLETLHLDECHNLQTLPELPSSLISLIVQDSSALTSLSLANLVNLKELQLYWVLELKELENVSSLRKLEKMGLNSVKISTLPEEIGAFLRLKNLDLRDCHRLKTLPTLPSSLSALRIRGGSSLERLPDLSNLKNLLKLWVMDCPKLREIEGLGNILSLKDLNTDGCLLTKLDGLERLESLIALSAGWSQVERLPDLSKLRNLKFLSVPWSRKLVEIRGLSRLKKLKRFCIDSCRSLKRLPELPYSLEELSLRGCEQFSEIEVVAELETLQMLDINSCRSLTKLPNLSRLQRLERFIMRDCESITEISGLEELSKLRVLNIFGCKALKLPDLSKQKSNGLQIHNNSKQDLYRSDIYPIYV
ncbi:TMV resistance protein N-like isoform X1 [Punica granatum]|uniref:TMV resistance protein N-like isoform X1 n=2 Tax=Punica granatum TaxID=22663 RepID=A0A6P8CP64_PUNGR|nr:TMV resistance protein N-like isoform X1 [Punica granatum]XP_031383175.1 TMV resistance protein N-like isoform X1 [Punica granatum]XP_031383176.1 TMV resistance protein N-like isoform X1 [Punica granatum]XP_031383177.1 TMV resistance protein N-like isoform X1 [Punica granatum]XP_031383178.1 TMV resistance protein N-like isoform X1 [Punica granatum]